MQDDVVTDFVFDKGKIDFKKAVYIPNTDFINNQINDWSKQKIEFCGIVHTHPNNQRTLSADDIYYIKNIMSTMPKTISYLYFPIIIPHKNIISYKAEINKGKIDIYADEIIVI